MINYTDAEAHKKLYEECGNELDRIAY